MRHIAALGDDKMPPRDEEFHFRTRAKSMVDKWHQILNANKPGPGSPTISAIGNAPANGKTTTTTESATAALATPGADEVTKATENIDLNGKGMSLRQLSFLFC